MIDKLKKYWFILAIILISSIRFLFTYKLPTFYLLNMKYDDYLMISYVKKLKAHMYLGTYHPQTLIKGPLFAFLLFMLNLYEINFACGLTLIYILSALYFTLSLKNIFKNKKFLILIYIILLFNPVTYSQDLFQRLYRNSISFIELYLFLGTIVRILFTQNKKILNYILFGVSISLMYLTREDNIWIYPILLFIPIYTFMKNKNVKTILLNLIPFVILFGSLNIISLINYNHYGIYTYNEIQKSEFHNTYKKILQIKDDEKIEKVIIPKSTLYKLSDLTETFNLTKEEIDSNYEILADDSNEIYNGNIIWYLRNMIYQKNRFKSGKESEEYYKKLGQEIDKLFKEDKLEKEFIMPSIFMSVPNEKQIKKIPVNFIDAVKYTTTYKNIKTMTDTSKYLYDKELKTYYFSYNDYHYTINIVDKNPIKYEIIRVIYECFTILLSIISLIIYFKNILKFDRISILSHILVISYCLILGGIVYTHTTSFHSIRPLYFGNIYIIQSIFILINLGRFGRENKQ